MHSESNMNSNDPPIRIDLDRFMPYRISILSSLIGYRVSDAYSIDPGMSSQEWKVMSILGHHGAIPSGDIGKHVTLDRVAISRAINKLESRGLIVRAPHSRDQRMFLVDLTAAGQKVYNQIALRALEAESAILSVLDRNEITELFRLMDKLDAYFRETIDPRRPALVHLMGGSSRE